MTLARVILSFGLVGCSQIFGLEAPALNSDAAITVDTLGAADASACVMASAECVSNETLRMCTGPGADAIDTTCTWGCVSQDGAHCGRLVPSGGGVTPDELGAGTGLLDTTLMGTLVIDGDNGRIGTAVNPSLVRGPGTGIINGIDHQVIGGVAIFRFATLTSTINGFLVGVGTKPIALVSIGDVQIAGTIDMRGGCVGTTAGPGGSAGASSGVAAGGAGGGGAGITFDRGGGGGGHGATGGAGGNNAGTAGASFGDATITALRGGGGGGGGGVAAEGGDGGGGGGAIQIVSNGRVTIISTGGINAGGCGGLPGGSGSDSGGGGGAGGTILIEAHDVTVAGKLAVNGGGGGGGDGGQRGFHGRLDRTAAQGGSGQPGDGGDGAAGATLTGGDGMGTGPSGGGGGAIGRIRINTKTAAASVISGAILSPALNDPATTATQGPAIVQ